MYELKFIIHIMNSWLSKSQLCINSMARHLATNIMLGKSQGTCCTNKCDMWWYKELCGMKRCDCYLMHCVVGIWLVKVNIEYECEMNVI